MEQALGSWQKNAGEFICAWPSPGLASVGSQLQGPQHPSPYPGPGALALPQGLLQGLRLPAAQAYPAAVSWRPALGSRGGLKPGFPLFCCYYSLPLFPRRQRGSPCPGSLLAREEVACRKRPGGSASASIVWSVLGGKRVSSSITLSHSVVHVMSAGSLRPPFLVVREMQNT